uniref:EGF-like domain-containing protein n=1 Tax=Panagrolaimus sp. PS1159 TaxID=55785 RepID=A0AC35FIW2_9BILA
MFSKLFACCLVLSYTTINAQFINLPCDRTDCNNRGTCLGTKTAPLCFCELGSSGTRCEQGKPFFESPFQRTIGLAQCDSKIACSGNGICVGNSLQNSCICNLGYTGLRCENSPTSGNDLFGLFKNWLGSGTDPMGSWSSLFGLNNLLKPLSTANLPYSNNPNIALNPVSTDPIYSSVSFYPFNDISPNAVVLPMAQPPSADSSGNFYPQYPQFPQTNNAMIIGNAVDNGMPSVIPQNLPVTAANYSLPLNQGLDICGPQDSANYSLPINQGLDICGPQDCNNQGVCIGSKALPVCLCYVGFSGTKCETNIFNNVNIGDSGHSIICSASDCNNNGVCIGTKGSFTCACKLGFSGRRCESTPYPLCDASDCNNNGLCIGTKGAFTCACHVSYSGERCERAQGTLCELSDCNSQGICIGTKDQFTCLCNLGYTGKRCESRVLDTVAPLAGGLFCELKDCSNNGLCVGTKLLPTCLCNLGYLGLRCEIEPLCFSPLQCSGNGLCLGTAKNFICACNLGWSGTNCQFFSG